MRIKYKKLRLLVTSLALIVGVCVFAGFGLAAADPAPINCSADNSAICQSGSKGCTGKDANGNPVDCPTTDPALSSSNAACGKSATSGCDLIGKYINPFIQLLSILVGVVAVISIVFAGIQYTTSEGDSQKVSKAKGRIANTIFALLAYAFLYAFLQFIVPGGIFNRS